MEKKPGMGAVLASGLIALAAGCVSIGYGLSAILNNLDMGPVLTGTGGGAVALGTILIVRAWNSRA